MTANGIDDSDKQESTARETSRRQFLGAAAAVAALPASKLSDEPAGDQPHATDLAELSISDLPKVDVDVRVEIPEEIEEIARARYDRGVEQFDDSETRRFEDYLFDHLDLDVEFVAADSGTQVRK